MKCSHCLAIAFVFAISFEARADVSAATCRIYSVENLNPSFAANIKNSSGVAARICKLPGGKVESTFLLTRARREGRVCLFEQWEARADGSIRHDQNGHYTGQIMRFMAVSDAPRCPGLADRSYIAANEVSPWLFLELSRFWDSLSNSNTFELATASLPDRGAYIVNEARQLFRANSRPKLSSVRLRVEDQSFQSGYALTTPLAGGWELQLTVDLTRNGFVVRSINSVIY